MPTPNYLASARHKLSLIHQRLEFKTNLIANFKILHQKKDKAEAETMSPSVLEKPDAASTVVRLFREEDEDAVMDICRKTAHEAAQLEPARTLVPYIFALPYVMIHPEYCWVVDNGIGEVVGYIVAVPDSEEYLRLVKQEYLPYLTARDPVRWAPPIINGDGSISPVMPPGNEIERVGRDGGPEKVAEALMARLWSPDESILHRAWPALLEEYPCHLHIDILPEYERQGLGTKLMTVLLEKLKEARVQGIHLFKSGDNLGTEVFYRKLGFERYQVDMGGSNTGELGVKPGGGVCMVRKV